jgi:hypothetical protein
MNLKLKDNLNVADDLVVVDRCVKIRRPMTIAKSRGRSLRTMRRSTPLV